MRALICATGSHGDVLPFIALGRALKQYDCEVFILTHRYFSQRIEDEGLKWIGGGESAEEYQQLLRDPQLTDSYQGTKILARAITENLSQDLDTLRSYVIPGQTVVIGSTLSPLPRLLKETDKVYCVTTHLAPVLLRCQQRLPRLGVSRILPRLPRPAPALLWYLLDRLVFDPAFAPRLNQLLNQLELPPAKRVLGDWLHGVDMVLGMFPEWLVKPRLPWPTPLSLTGFPTAHAAQQGSNHQLPEMLPESIKEFIAAGPAPVVFTSGTATRCNTEFFQASIAACQLNGQRGILVDAHGGAPDKLPEDIMSSGYAPFSQLLPHAAAIVHHGGIGTFSTALAAGTPQLIRPMAYDQFDNSAHARKLGVGLELLPRRYTGKSAAQAIDSLLADPHRARACSNLAQRVKSEDGAANGAKEIVTAAAQEGL